MPQPSGRKLGSDDSDESAVPGYKNYVVYTDETGMHGSLYYAFGSLWMPWERRGDFQAEIRALRARHRLADELKWKKQSRRTEPFAKDVITLFFRLRWLMFHCVVVNNTIVNRELHKDKDEAQQKHFSMLLKHKIGYFARGGGKLYRVRVDPLPWRYPKSDEVVHKIVNAQLKAELGEPLVHDVIACQSKLTLGIQVADLLLGAVLAAWQGDVEAPHKKRLMSWVADHLGWSDLKHDTHMHEWKFNVWHFFDPTSGLAREARTLPVKLRYSMPAFRPSDAAFSKARK